MTTQKVGILTGMFISIGNLIDPENLIEKYIVQNKWPQCPIEYNTRTMTNFSKHEND